MTNTLDHALFYAKQGWRVFPCMPREKVPAAAKWPEVATTDEKMIYGWWDHNEAFNVGIACGEKSGLTVLDVDADHDGYESLRDLIMEYGNLPETPVAKTGSGGEHIFFKYVPGTRNSAGKLGKGLDIRSEGGFVVGANSLHPNGMRYEWLIKPSQVPLAEMPEWLVELLRERNPIQTVEYKSTEGKITHGGRNDAMFRMAGALRRKGLNDDEIFAAVYPYNLRRCDPPLTEAEVRQLSNSATRYPAQDEPQPAKLSPTIWDVFEKIENKIIERQKNPRDVWGIHYAWNFLSLITGGKQKGELIIGAGEPGVGKSWFFHQDALYSALGDPKQNIPSTPVLVWSGEMSREQVFKRMLQMLGVPKRSMETGNMSAEDWQIFNEAKALIGNSPLYVSDESLSLKEVKGMLEREKDEHGIEQVVFDYDWLISAPGENEIQQSQNISKAMKQLSRELDLSIILISSVNKGGMDSMNENVAKSHVSGSGKKIHDADVVYILTKFNEKKNGDTTIKPADYGRIATLHIAKGRELDFHVPNGAINYIRETPNPKFKELKPAGATPDWMKK